MLYILIKNQFSLKHCIFKFLAVCLIWFLFVYIIRSLLFGLLFRYEHVEVYDYVSFDFVIQGPSRDYYNHEISAQPFVRSSMKTILTGGDLLHNGEYGTTSTMNIDGDNFESLFEIFPRKLFVSVEESLLTRRDGIFLSFGLARALHIQQGDMVSISGRDKIVVGIYEDAIFNIIHADSITLWDEAYGAKIGGVFFEFYEKVYIKTSDYNKAAAYFDTTYFNHLDYISNIVGNGNEADYIKKYGEQWIEKAIEETASHPELRADYQSNKSMSHKLLKAYAENEYAQYYTLNQDIAYSVVSILALFSVCVLESYRHAKENQQKFAILRTLGSRRGSIWAFYFMRSFILQSVLMFSAIAYVRYRTSQNVYVSNILIFRWLLFFEIVILVAALISSVVSMRKLSDKALLFSLNAEGTVD